MGHLGPRLPSGLYTDGEQKIDPPMEEIMRFNLLECIAIGLLSLAKIFGVFASIFITPESIQKADFGNRVMASVFSSDQMGAIQNRSNLEKLVIPPCYPIIHGGCDKPSSAYSEKESIVDIDKMHRDVNAIFSTMEKGSH